MKYCMTSQSFEGSVLFGYDEVGNLVYFQNESNMNAAQHNWLLKHLPTNIEQLPDIKVSIKGTLEEVPEDLSFDVFWNLYDKKINRKRCEAIYDRLNEADKLAAIKSIKPYNQYLQRTKFRAKKDPDGYLRDRYFETEWKREKV